MDAITIPEFITMKDDAQKQIEAIIVELYENSGFMVQSLEIQAKIGVKNIFIHSEMNGKFFPRKCNHEKHERRKH